MAGQGQYLADFAAVRGRVQAQQQHRPGQIVQQAVGLSLQSGVQGQAHIAADLGFVQQIGHLALPGAVAVAA